LKEFFFALAAFVMINILLGGVRIARGPTRADRMLAAQFLTTASVAIFLLLSEALEQPALRNLSLVFVVLATLTTVAFAQAYSGGKGDKK